MFNPRFFYVKPRRWYVNLEINYTDVMLDQSIDIEYADNARISYPEQTYNSKIKPHGKILSADGLNVLDGSYVLAPVEEEASIYEMGWWSSEVAGDDGVFENAPSLKVKFSKRSLKKLTVVGDSERGEWPVDFTVKFYQEGVVLKQYDVWGNSLIKYESEIDVVGADEAELIIWTWSHGNTNAKITEFITSLKQKYYDPDIIRLRLTEEAGSKMKIYTGVSENELRLTLLNKNGRFSVDNINNPLRFMIKPNRRVVAYMNDAPNFEEKSWEFEQPTFSREGKARYSDWSLVWDNLMRIEPVDGIEAVFVEEGTTNLLENGMQSWLNPYTFSNAEIKNEYGITWAVLTGEGEYYEEHSEDADNYVFQLRYKKKNGNFKMFIEHSDGSRTEKTLEGEEGWEFLKIEDKDVAKVGISGNGAIWTTAWQLEKKLYPTSFIEDTRNDENLTLSLSGDNELYMVVYSRALGEKLFASGDWTVYDDRIVGTSSSLSFGGRSGWLKIHIKGADVYLNGDYLGAIDGSPGNDAQFTGRWHAFAEGSLIEPIGNEFKITDSLSNAWVVWNDKINTRFEDVMKLGEFWTIEWKVKEESMKADIVARDRMRLLKLRRYDTAQIWENISLYDVLDDLLYNSKIGEYWIDPVFSSVIFDKVLLGDVTFFEALQKLLEAGLGYAYTDRDGTLKVVSYKTLFRSPLRRELQRSDYYKRVVPNSEKLINSVDVVINKPVVGESKRVFSGTVDGEVRIRFENPAEVTLSNADLDYTVYSWGVVITGSGSVDVDIAPYEFEQTIVNYKNEDSINENGEVRIKIDNPLITNKTLAKYVADGILFLASETRTAMNVALRGDPTIVVGDLLKVYNEWGGYFQGVAYSRELDYKPTIRDVIYLRKGVV